MGPSEYPDMARDAFSKPAPDFSPFTAPQPVATGKDQPSFSYPPQPQSGYSSYSNASDPHMAIELEKERMRLEFMRLEAERREREDRYEREERQRRERETYEREREAAHQRALQLHAQTQVSQTTLSAQTAMVTTANASHGFGVVGGTTVIAQENYCGPISWIIGLFLFPCICCCPVDTRPVTVARPAPVIAAPAAVYNAGHVAGVPIYNAPGHVVMK